MVGHSNLFKYMNREKREFLTAMTTVQLMIVSPPPNSSGFFVSCDGLIGAIPTCQSASPRLQFLYRFPCISDPNLDDFGVI
jgi:hypothetical protein